MIATSKALREVERLARELVDKLDGAVLCGECDTECNSSEECGKTSTVNVVCPKCAEKFDVESECNGIFECAATCTADVEVDLAEDDDAALRNLRLALVALDMARAGDGEAPIVSIGVESDDASAVSMLGQLRGKVSP